jgi:hypothetical protein
MEGLVLPVVLFTAFCVALGFKLGAVSALRRRWDVLRVRKLLQMELPRSHYTVMHNVYLPGQKEPVCIDHLVVSAYGIFAIKQIPGNGRISGKPGDARWTRTSMRSQHVFANPLFECLNEVNALRGLLGVDASLLNFVLVFTGNIKFSAPMPVNVTKLDGLPLFIEGRDKLVIDFDQLPILVGRIKAARPAGSVSRNHFQPAPR